MFVIYQNKLYIYIYNKANRQHQKGNFNFVHCTSIFVKYKKIELIGTFF